MKEADAAFSVLVESGVPKERIMWGVRNTALEDGTFDGFGSMLGGREVFLMVQKECFRNGAREEVYDWRLIDCLGMDSHCDFLHRMEREFLEGEALKFQMRMSRI